METLIIIVFVIGYLAIALEHSIKINKTASAILTGVICWTLFAVATPTESILNSSQFANFLEGLKIDLADKFSTLGQHELYIRFVGSELSHHLAQFLKYYFSSWAR